MRTFTYSLLASICIASSAISAPLPTSPAALKQAAEAGNEDAAFAYAESLMRTAQRKPALKEEALFWYKLAAQQGSIEAMITLGQKYKSKELPAPSATSAQELFNLAHARLKADANQGDASAATHLGELYKKGDGVEKDLDQAIHWLKKGAEAGSRRAKFTLGRSALWGTTPGFSKQDALDLLHEAAADGLVNAWLQIGLAYSGAFGGDVNHPRAFDAFKRAADGGNTEAMRLVAMAYFSGLGVDRNDAAAIPYLKKSAALNDPDAMFNLAQAYRFGTGVSKSAAQSIYWLRKAAAHNVIDAHYYLGLAYRDGDGVGRNKEKAIEHFRTATTKKHVLAIIELEKLSPKKVYIPEDEE